MYLFREPARYNWFLEKPKVDEVPAVLDVLKAHHADNYGWALACCVWQRDLAEDVLQESYLRVLDGRAEFAGRSSHKTWFFAVIKRVAADVQRKGKRHMLLNLRILVGDRDNVDSMRDDSPADVLQRTEDTQRLQAQLLQLSVRQREVLHLTFYAQLTLEEAAQTLGISVGSARTHYHRGKERLAQLLENSDDHEY